MKRSYIDITFIHRYNNETFIHRYNITMKTMKLFIHRYNNENVHT